jgi:hypothetical protein
MSIIFGYKGSPLWPPGAKEYSVFTCSCGGTASETRYIQHSKECEELDLLDALKSLRLCAERAVDASWELNR